MTQWVSFQEIKQQVSIEDILRHYGLMEALRQKDDELIGLCPFHQETKGSFHASVTKQAWNCFGCKRKGNILDFVAFKEEVEIRQAALLIQDWFLASPKEPLKAPEKSEKPQTDVSVPLEQENQTPLTFELKNLDPKHPYLKERGLEKETIQHFGLGFCSRGLMKGRIAVPIESEQGTLAYAGRYPGEPPEGEEKYMLPPGFAKSNVLFNLHRAKEVASESGLILVEGFFDAFRIWQAGFPQVVALMGSWLSEKQKELLVSSLGSQGKITLLFDADDAGRECETQCLQELSDRLFVKAVKLPYDGDQPDKLSDNVIRALLAG